MAYKLARDKELTAERLRNYMAKWRMDIQKRYEPLYRMYKTEYDIFKAKEKPSWKPDNRLAVNFAKYISDTMNGFFLGIPVKTVTDDTRLAEYVQLFTRYNDEDAHNAEVAKLTDIFGVGYEMYYVDDNKQVCMDYATPLEAFMIVDDSVLERPRYFVRTWLDEDGKRLGSVSDENDVWYFSEANMVFGERFPHGFAGVPATEFRGNDERMGLYEPVMSLINAYNKVISEKADDVEYFADAYMKVLGAKLEDEDLNWLRQNRIINFEGEEVGSLQVDFLSKPSADATQENFLNRVEKLIFQISMVANISDENFGAASGISLRYKLQAMSNVAKTKERKFINGLNRRYKLVCSNVASPVAAEDWTKLEFVFTQNYPSNLLEESQIANNLNGIVSDETRLKVLSIVDDVKAETERMAEELYEGGYSSEYNTERVTEDENDTH